MNKGYRYILTCIDIFSKFAWVIPTKDKTGLSMIHAFRKNFKTRRKPKKLQTDKGTEYTNNIFQKFLKRENVHFYTSENDEIKASIVERFNRTLKNKMYKYFTASKTEKYIDLLPDMIKSYNTSKHRTIGMTPTEASQLRNPSDIVNLYNKIYSKVDKMKFSKKKFKIGDLVRISKYKGAFEKGYTPNYTTEVFQIKKIYKGKPDLYSIVDVKGVLVAGRFYSEEMKIYDGKTFKKLIKKRKRGNVQQFFIEYDWHKPEWVNARTYYKLLKG